MAVTKRARFEVLRRDNYTCRYCRATDQPLTVDHVQPQALGGSDSPDNLVACCKDCNSGKTSTTADATLVAQVSDDAVRWSQAIAQAAAEMAADRAPARKAVAKFDRAWKSYGAAPRKADWATTVERWLGLGLSADELVECVHIGMGHGYIRQENIWRYVCGVAWSKVTQLQERAKALTAPAATDSPEDDELEGGEDCGWADAQAAVESQQQFSLGWDKGYARGYEACLTTHRGALRGHGALMAVIDGQTHLLPDDMKAGDFTSVVQGR